MSTFMGIVIAGLLIWWLLAQGIKQSRPQRLYAPPSLRIDVYLHPAQQEVLQTRPLEEPWPIRVEDYGNELYGGHPYEDLTFPLQ